ncbi:MAG: peptidylprolyl isomerase, partial [Candidatus Thiodiazotropha sp.]
ILNTKDQKGIAKINWLKEPMLHFIAVGLLVFVVNDLIQSETVSENLIVIDDRVRNEIVQEFKQKKSREPSEQELKKLLDAWLQSELLYRKGVEMGLAENDTMIRDRVIQKTVSLFRSLAAQKEPSAEQLHDWYQEKSANYQKQPSYDFEHVLIRDQGENGKMEVETIKEQVLGGKQASDFKQAYHQFVGRKRAALSVTFGKEFVANLDNVPVNEWRIINSNKGWHLLRLQDRHQQPLPEFDQLEPLLRRDWQKQQQNEQVVKLIEELRNIYTILHQSS